MLGSNCVRMPPIIGHIRGPEDIGDKSGLKGFIPKHGGYQKLLSFQKTEVVYDATVFLPGSTLGALTARLIK